MPRSLRATFPLLAVIALAAPPLAAQSARPGGAVIGMPNTTYAPVPGVDFGGDPALSYRFAWAISAGADSAQLVNDAYYAPARVLNTLAADGVSPTRVQLAVVARGPAIVALLGDSAYRAVHGRENPNTALLRELHAKGVRLIVCGQTMVGRRYPREAFLPFVQVSRAATVAQARLAAEGFVFNPF
jgi:intracellular sulfur oxidation DsrE/DsrF family protein